MWLTYTRIMVIQVIRANKKPELMGQSVYVDLCVIFWGGKMTVGPGGRRETPTSRPSLMLQWGGHNAPMNCVYLYGLDLLKAIYHQLHAGESGPESCLS